MILTQLERDADFLADLPPVRYDRKAVRRVVHLDTHGKAQWPPDTTTSGAGGKKDAGKVMVVPFVGRTAAIRPILLADKTAYTWGRPPEGADEKRVGRTALEHRSFLDLLERCARETGELSVAAVHRFLSGWDAEIQPLPDDLKDADLTTFCVDGVFPADLPSVRAFWAREVGGDEEGTDADKGSLRGQCVVCSRETRVVKRLPVLLKGLPGGQSSGTALVSANANAFESYGRAEGLTSSICDPCGERYGKALNALLAGEKRRVRVGPLAYVFWVPGKEEGEFADFFYNPDPAQVRDLLNSAFTAKAPGPDEDAAFFAAALSANAGRAVVRHWLQTTLGAARRSLGRWFLLQRLISPQGDEGEPLSVFRLAVSLHREAREILGREVELLVSAALEGTPLPDAFLRQALLRNQAEGRLTYARAALIKAVLTSHDRTPKLEECQRMERLDPNDKKPAYLCGRLFAELDAIQRVAISPRATLTDRYYGAASSAPASVFGSLIRTAQNHLAVLRKTRPGAYRALDRRLGEIMTDLHTWPRTLTLHDQALFALGFYHQRAEDARAAAAAKAAKQAAEDAPVELADDAEG